MQESEILTLFEVKGNTRNKCLKGIECSFYIKIYSAIEFEEIKEKIKEELNLFPNVNGNMLQFIKEKYRISSKDLRSILKADYYRYNKAETKNAYLKLENDTYIEKQKEEIIKKWKNKDDITIKSIRNIIEEKKLTFEEIGKILEISKKDLEELKSDKIKKVKIDLQTEKEKQEYRQKIENGRKYKLSKKLVEQFAESEGMSIGKAGKILGIDSYKLKKLIEQKQLTIKASDHKLKNQVEKIALDLKYLPNNGNRYYKEDETNFMSLFYKINSDDIFYYLASGKTEYDTYKEALKNNPNGVWIGEKCRISNEYIERNYELLRKMILQIANKIIAIYNCNEFDKEDFVSEAFEYILRNGGFFEKNLYYDEEKLNFILTKNLSYIMQVYYKKQPKDFRIICYSNGVEYENEEILRDDRYNPELYLTENRYSYLKEIEPLHKKVVEELSRNKEFAINFPKKFFSRTARKYQMKEDEMEEVMGEIRAFILKNDLIKITKDGKIISMFYVDE